VEDTSTRDPIWDDLAVIAFELLAKPDRAGDVAARGDDPDADHEEDE
jgi:hypothetical protein